MDERVLLIFLCCCCITAFAIPTPTCDFPGFRWTRFFDRDNPSGSCDCELFQNLRTENPGQICANPKAVDARVKKLKLDYRSTGQVVTVNQGGEKGLRCANSDNPEGCLDYEIRFCCDYDECQDEPCHQHATCTNTIGGYTCACKNGFEGNGYHCEAPPVVCPRGYSWTQYFDRDDPSGTCDCEDHANLRKENPGKICSNPRSVDARLVANNLDYRVAGQTVTIATAAEKGFKCVNSANSIGCFDYKVRFCCDVNECASSPCHANALCINLPGTYRCQCKPGYIGDGRTCYPIPTCSATGYQWTKFYDRDDPTGNCDCELFANLRTENPGEICANPTAINARVKSSRVDYRLTGQVIKAGTATEKGLDCRNANNKNRCLDYEIRFCCDVDECASSPCDSNARCTNLPGSFRCQCNAGYIGDGFKCVRIPTCSATGYQWTKFYDRDDPSGNCDCELFSNLRSENPGEICANPTAINARVKSSRLDYRLTGQVIEAGTAKEKGLDCRNANNKNRCLDYEIRFCCDVNECESSPCDGNARCTNTPGSFTCRCNSGFVGDGFSCYPVPKCSHGYDWTKFYDRDDPSGNCDCELFANLRTENPGEICANPTAIDARVKSSRLDYRLTGQVIEAGTATEKGLDCRNAKNKNRCLDYEIRFCCDVDECANSPCHVNAKCTNLPGSFKCECNAGYRGNGYACVPEPVCKFPNVWTKFYDRDDPSGTCDCETFSDLRRENPSICSHPSAMEGRVKSSKVDYRLAGQTVIAYTSAEKGLRCNNDDNKGKCHDYEIRFCCRIKLPFGR